MWGGVLVLPPLLKEDPVLGQAQVYEGLGDGFDHWRGSAEVAQGPLGVHVSPQVRLRDPPTWGGVSDGAACRSTGTDTLSANLTVTQSTTKQMCVRACTAGCARTVNSSHEIDFAPTPLHNDTTAAFHQAQGPFGRPRGQDSVVGVSGASDALPPICSLMKCIRFNSICQ